MLIGATQVQRKFEPAILLKSIYPNTALRQIYVNPKICEKHYRKVLIMSEVKLQTSIMKGVVTEFGLERGRAGQMKRTLLW